MHRIIKDFIILIFVYQQQDYINIFSAALIALF